jgi:integrase
MKISIGQNRGHLLWQFRWNGKLKRIHMGMDDTQENRRKLKPRLKELQLKLGAGQFDLAKEFPNAVPASERMVSLLVYANRLNEESIVSEETKYDRRSLYRHHLEPAAVAQRPIDQITKGDLRSYLSELLKEDVGRRKKMVVERLGAIFRTAVEDGLIENNPMPAIKKIRTRKMPIDPFNADERKKIIDAATGQPQSLITLLFETGLRPNELTPTTWPDVDWKAPTLAVDKALTRKRRVALPKTQESQRLIDLRPGALRALREQRARLTAAEAAKADAKVVRLPVGPRRPVADLIFPNKRGGHMNLGNFLRRTWKSVLDEAKVKYRPIKFTRHSFAVMMIEEGHELRYIAQQMGHVTLEMIIRHYSRWLTASQQAMQQQARK